MPRTEQEQVEQVGRYVDLLHGKSDRLWRRQRFLTMLMAIAFAVLSTAGIGLLLRGDGDASTEVLVLVIVIASAVGSVVAWLLAGIQIRVRTTQDRLLSLHNANITAIDSTSNENSDGDGIGRSTQNPTTTTSRIAKSLS